MGPRGDGRTTPATFTWPRNPTDARRRERHAAFGPVDARAVRGDARILKSDYPTGCATGLITREIRANAPAR